MARDFVDKKKYTQLRQENDKISMRYTLMKQILLTPDTWDIYQTQLKKLEKQKEGQGNKSPRQIYLIKRKLRN